MMESFVQNVSIIANFLISVPEKKMLKSLIIIAFSISHFTSVCFDFMNFEISY